MPPPALAGTAEVAEYVEYPLFMSVPVARTPPPAAFGFGLASRRFENEFWSGEEGAVPPAPPPTLELKVVSLFLDR